MPDYNLGTARGRIEVQYQGDGVRKAKEDLKTVEGSAKRSGETIQKTGQAAGVAGGAIAVGLGLAARTAIDFEKQISAIGAVSGASQADLEQFRQKALQLGADTSFSASQAALAMEELAKAGLSTPDILNGAADAAVALAAAGGVELPEAAELAADAMTSFGLSAGELPGIADRIAGAANASSIGVSQFGQSLKQVGAVANLAGISFDDTATAIALLGANGIKGSDAGTSLKTMLSNLLPVTAAQKGQMMELGLLTREGGNAFVDASGKMKSLSEISELLQTSTAHLTDTQKQLALETIFGSDAIRAAAVLTKGGAEGFDQMAASMGKVTAEEVAAARLNNTAGAIEQLKGSAETAAIGLATALLPAITKITKALTSVTNAFNQLSPGTKETITNIALVASGILLAVFVITKIIAAAKAFMVAWRLLNLSFIASPIGLIITAIVLLVAAFVILWNKSEAFRNFWKGLWEGIQKAASAVADWFMNTVVPLIKRAWELIFSVIKFYWGLVKTVLDGATAALQFWWPVISGILEIIWKLFKLYFGFVVAVIKGAVDLIVAYFKFWIDKIGEVARTIGAVLGKIVDAFGDMYRSVMDKLRPFIDVLMGIRNRILNALGDFGSFLYNKGRDLIQGLIDGMVSMITSVRNTAADIVGGIADYLPGSPAKKGPLSGRGYVLRRGQRMGEDFAAGILANIAQVSAAAGQMADSVGIQLPSPNNAAIVSSAARSATAPAVMVSPVFGGSQSGPSINIESLNIEGTWDLADATVPRRFVGRLHEELDRYAKGYA